MFLRTALDSDTGKPLNKIGFQMNKVTKPAAVTALVRALRSLHEGETGAEWDAAFIERSAAACDEFDGYVVIDGKQTHRDGEHDERVDTRAILLYVDGHENTAPCSLASEPRASRPRVVTAADF